MDLDDIRFSINVLKKNAILFQSMFDSMTASEIHFKSDPDKWNNLEVICHLHDEEQFDFRARIKILLEGKKTSFVPFDPKAMVIDHKYLEQDFHSVAHQFLQERQKSISWLLTNINGNWDTSIDHQHYGKMSARFLLHNWMVHDQIHIRQFMKNRVDFIVKTTNTSIDYAGNW